MTWERWIRDVAPIQKYELGERDIWKLGKYIDAGLYDGLNGKNDDVVLRNSCAAVDAVRSLPSNIENEVCFRGGKIPIGKVFKVTQTETGIAFEVTPHDCFKEDKMKTNKTRIPEVTKIIHNGPATVVFWDDKTKTVVKQSENDIYDEYSAFTAALAIKLYGSNSHLKKVIKSKTVEGKND